MNITPQLLRFAEVLLGTHFPEFQMILSDFHTLDSEDFGKKHPCFELLCGDLEDDMDEDVSDEDDFSPVLLLLYAEEKQLMARVDWAGEDEPGGVAAFVERMLQKRKISGFSWDNDTFNASLDLENLKRGEYVPLLLKAIDERLQECDCRLIVFFIGDDSYPFAVLRKDECTQVDSLAWGVYGVFCAENMNEYRPEYDYDSGEDEE